MEGEKMAETIQVDGACFCGQVSLTAQADSDKVIACHCTDCQTFSGAPFRPVIIIPAEDIEISGVVKEFQKIADSGNARLQGFCGDCGTQLYATDMDKSVFNVRTGCLNQKAVLEPKKHIFGKSTPSWLSDMDKADWLHAGPGSEGTKPFNQE